jgi:glycosyltransferase involved in cell wall biosynthesis
LRSLLAGLLGANRPKVIAVFGTTRAEVECAIRHARTSSIDLPVWAWCAEEQSGDLAPVVECERFSSGAGYSSLRKELGEVWPALSIVAWTGKPGNIAMKLLPLATPPFRVVIFNEAEGFFASRPFLIAIHVKRRIRDDWAAKFQWSVDWLQGAAGWLQRAARRLGMWIIEAGLLLWLLALAILALAAQWTAPLSYRAVRRKRDTQPLSLDPEELQQDSFTPTSFTEVAIPNRGWPRRAVMRAAMESDAGFIVLRMSGERASAVPLIAVARETNAFAVAKQSAHSAWRKQVVHKHPFRHLQEGEVSEVFAPFSSLLVLRRKMLLRLGFPHALTYGGALEILFWRSSAAGLRSLAVGHEGFVPDESSMALEDVELALRLTVSPALAALGPASPSRFRGNIAWSPAHRKEFRGKMRVLVISPYLPFPLSHGGAVRIYNLCRSLAGQVDFVLACFREANESVRYEELHQVFREVYIVDADEKHSDSGVPTQVAEYRNSAMSDLVRSMCLERQVDLVQIEYTQMAEYREDTGAVPVILVEHDITFTLYNQLADFDRKPRTRQNYDRWLEFERAALQCSNLVWTMSPDERSVALAHGAPRNFTRVVPNGVDLRRFMPAAKPAGPPKILFVGSFRHLPNLLAFESLRTSIMPAVWRECPDAVVHVIAGPNYERAAGLAGKADLLIPDSRIVIQGFVEDVRPAYRAADVIAVSLPLSAGTNIKLLEAMACGRAIVTTPAGCRGLELTDGQELIVADGGCAFSAAIVRLLGDEELRGRIAIEARRTAERRFGWDSIAREALDSYADLTRIPAASRVLQRS